MIEVNTNIAGFSSDTISNITKEFNEVFANNNKNFQESLKIF